MEYIPHIVVAVVWLSVGVYLAMAPVARVPVTIKILNVFLWPFMLIYLGLKGAL